MERSVEVRVFLTAPKTERLFEGVFLMARKGWDAFKKGLSDVCF